MFIDIIENCQFVIEVTACAIVLLIVYIHLIIFASSFLYPGVEVGAVAIGIVVAGVMACRGGNGGLRGGIS